MRKRWRATWQRCPTAYGTSTVIWEQRRWTWPAAAGWMTRARIVSRVRWLLIHHRHARGRSEGELPGRNGHVHFQLLQLDRALLTGALGNLEASHQSVGAGDPQLSAGVGQGRVPGREGDDVHPAGRHRVAAYESRAVALPRPIHELTDEIRSGGPGFRNAAADHLAGCGARRVEPEIAPVGDDA